MDHQSIISLLNVISKNGPVGNDYLWGDCVAAVYNIGDCYSKLGKYGSYTLQETKKAIISWMVAFDENNYTYINIDSVPSILY